MQRTARLSRRDFDFFLEQNVTGIETFIHIDDGDPGFAITRRNRRLDRRRTAPARQDRGVQIEACNRWNFEDLARQNLPVSHYDNHIWIQTANFLNRLWQFDPGRL